MKNVAIQVACAIIENPQNQVFVAKRSEKMPHSFKWEFPGGKLQDNETPEDCLHRELKEELAIQVSIKTKLPVNIWQSENRTILFHAFICDILSTDFQLIEHCEGGFFAIEKLNDLDWLEADKAILKNYLKIHQ